MPTTITLPMVHEVALGGESIIPIDFTTRLRTINGTQAILVSATAVEQTTSTLGITDTEVNDATYIDDYTGATVNISKGVWFRVIPTLAGTYTVLVTGITNSTNPGREVLPYLVTIVVA